MNKNGILYTVLISLLGVISAPKLLQAQDLAPWFEEKPASPPKVLPDTSPRGSIPAATPQIKFLEVTDVAPWDELNVRAEPGTRSSIVGKFAYNTRGLSFTGEEVQLEGQVWRKVYGQKINGWVNARYLRPQLAQTPTSPPTAPPPTALPPAKDSSKTTPRTSASDSGLLLQCGGTEPFWRMDIYNTSMNVDLMDGQKFSVPVMFRRPSENSKTISITGGQTKKEKVIAFFEESNRCSDGMSDLIYPYGTTIMINSGQVLSGCCGSPKRK